MTCSREIPLTSKGLPTRKAVERDSPTKEKNAARTP